MTHQPAIQWPHNKMTAPKWEESPIDWTVYYLKEEAQVYREFRRLCDDALRRNPGMTLSADRVLHVIRWETEVKAMGDKFHVNDHASALFARLYKLERPNANFRSRKSIFDMLSKNEWQRILNAFEPIRVRAK